MRRHRLAGVLIGLVIAAVLAFVARTMLDDDGSGGQASFPPLTTFGVRASGNQLVDQHGQTVQLRGVNRPGTEYRCVSATPGFTSDKDGAQGQALSYASTIATSLQRWNRGPTAPNAINTVRVPMNEDCWLGINGVDPLYSGPAYQEFIEREVAGLTAAGMYTVLDLHWSAPGELLATSQDVGPDADHAVAFWKSVATTFKDNQAVLFDLYNEPRMSCFTKACKDDYGELVRQSWGCYRDGCDYAYSREDFVPDRAPGTTIRIAGTSELTRAIRAAGALNVIVVEGGGYGNDLWNWMDYRPTGTDGTVDGNLVAELHEYQSSGVNIYDTGRLDDMVSDVVAHHPLYVGEFGVPVCDESDGFVERTMNWADTHGYSYAAWGWDQGEGTGCNGGLSLVIDDVTGETTPYGAIVRSHLQAQST